MADKPEPAAMEAPTAAFSFFRFVNTFWVVRNRTEFQNRFFPHSCIFKVEKLLIVFVDGWHIGEYNFVINNYILPKTFWKDRWKIQMGPELTRTPKSANNSAAIWCHLDFCKSSRTQVNKLSGWMTKRGAVVHATATMSEFWGSFPSTGYSTEWFPKPPGHSEAERLPLTDFQKMSGPVNCTQGFWKKKRKVNFR